MTRADRALLGSALAAAERGWHVFPCVADGKRPALRGNWQEIATTSPAQIRDWWSRAPFNIGISCGPSRLAVIDLDMPRPDMAWEDAGDGATAMTLRNRGEPSGFAAVTGRVMGRAIRRANEADLRRLKALLERGDYAPSIE